MPIRLCEPCPPVWCADFDCPACGNGWTEERTHEQETASNCVFCGCEDVTPSMVRPSSLLGP